MYVSKDIKESKMPSLQHSLNNELFTHLPSLNNYRELYGNYIISKALNSITPIVEMNKEQLSDFCKEIEEYVMHVSTRENRQSGEMDNWHIAWVNSHDWAKEANPRLDNGCIKVYDSHEYRERQFSTFAALKNWAGY